MSDHWNNMFFQMFKMPLECVVGLVVTVGLGIGVLCTMGSAWTVQTAVR